MRNATVSSNKYELSKFLTVVVEDNGDGFTKDEFVRLMNGGIGNSEKRPKECSLKRIDRRLDVLGIGMPRYRSSGRVVHNNLEG